MNQKNDTAFPASEGAGDVKELFLNEVLAQVRFQYDHPVIYRELLAHIEDREEFYLESGETVEDAQAMAVARMGDAAELGKALNREHSPLLGWLWRVSGVAAFVCVFAAVLLCFLPLCVHILSPVFSSVGGSIDQEAVVYEKRVGERVQIDDRVISIRKVVFTQNDPESDTGTLHVLWSTYEKRLHLSGWSYTLNGFFDDEGKEYYGNGSSSGGVLRFGCSNLENFPRDSEYLAIDYDKFHRSFHIKIPLDIPAADPKGEEAAS